MDTKAKENVKKFYESFYSDPALLRTSLHSEVELSWWSSTGFRKLSFDEISDFSREMAGTYEELRMEVKSIVAEDNSVALHFEYFASLIENPEEELPLARFMAHWELKEGKLYKGSQISQLTDTEIGDN